MMQSNGAASEQQSRFNAAWQRFKKESITVSVGARKSKSTLKIIHAPTIKSDS